MQVSMIALISGFHIFHSILFFTVFTEYTKEVYVAVILVDYSCFAKVIHVCFDMIIHEHCMSFTLLQVDDFVIINNT